MHSDWCLEAVILLLFLGWVLLPCYYCRYFLMKLIHYYCLIILYYYCLTLKMGMDIFHQSVNPADENATVL